MRMRVDAAADAVYLDLTTAEIDSSEEVSPGIILDYNVSGNLVGIEILDASRKAGVGNIFESVNLDMQAA